MMKSIMEIKEQQISELKALIDWAGNQTRLAHYLNIAPQVVSNWVARGRISASMAIEVEKVTNGAFTKRQLRPDVINWIDEE